MSDVPVGCSLSGGLDSSTVVGLMAEQGIRPIRTYTLGFAETQAQALDERALARQVARRFQTDHQEIVIQAESLLDDLEQMVWHLDEPYGGGLPSWFVFREMSREVKVAMTGSGGDELWGNYGLWRIYCPFSGYWAQEMGRRIRSSGWKNFIHYPHGALYHGYFGEQDKKLLWADSPAQRWESTPALRERLWRQAHTWDPRNAVPFIDFQMQLPEEFLLMTDRFSMAWSLEARTPLLDPRLVEFMLRLPPGVRTHPRDLKKLLKEAVADLLPPELLGAGKSGFVLPVGHWLRGRLRPMVEKTLGPSYLKQQGLFSPKIYDRYVLPHMRGQRDYDWQIWTLLMFQLWWAKYLGHNWSEIYS
jgi:asparagine synthase (glutamine-hydrolysing)